MSATDDRICLACDFLLQNNRDAGYSTKSSTWRSSDESADLEGIWGPVKIFIAEFERELIRHGTGRGVQAAPKCALFQLLVRAIELSFDRKVSAKYLKDDAVVLSLLKIEEGFKSEKGARTCKIRIADAEPPDRHRLAADFVPQLIEQPYHGVVRPDPNGPTSLNRIKQWIEKCDMKCTHCNNTSAQSPSSYPTRLIDVSKPPLRLVDTTSLSQEERLPYIALSHCWGGNRYFITQRNTISKRMRGFAMADLPTTFRDAVSLTRSLKVRYLWIDSVCIIQDDREDWRIESSRMCDIYSNAYLTIAATSASDDSQGFLRHRPSKAVCIDLIYPDQETIRFFLQPEKASNGYYSDSCDGPLHLRAWTLQERLLSRRVLGFASNQMYWECRGHKLQQESGYRITPPGHLTLLRPFEAEDDLRSLWHRLVEEYSERRLSDPRDKLVALEGLVERFSVTAADMCVAGLWKRHLLDDLLWRPYPGGSYSRSAVYRSPSWSWASIDGPVWYHERNVWRNVSHALVEEVNVQSGQPEIKEGYIVLQGSLLDITFPMEPQEGLNHICSNITWSMLLECNNSTTIPARSTATLDVLLDDRSNPFRYGQVNIGVILNTQMQSKDRNNNLAGFDKCRAVGLLLRHSEHKLETSLQNLQRFESESPGTFGDFERIGTFESEWLDMWTLQQLCTSTRRERIKII
ncbi:HET-domain-containing protein [Stipitochalara longipes BDJ]|nr:HET-domain-containing protein [Stipitochalara longipes BDJ]